VKRVAHLRDDVGGGFQLVLVGPKEFALREALEKAMKMSLVVDAGFVLGEAITCGLQR
jgi:hypothetical protein